MKFTILFVGLCVCSGVLFAQDSTKVEKALAYQQHLNREFSDSKTSPLTAEEIKAFESLPFFEIKDNLIFEAEFFRTPNESPFAMPNTTGGKNMFVKFGEVYFTIGGKEYQLNVYQSQRLSTDPAYADYLFVPFTDLTNGKTTYGGGRYLDLHIPESDTILLDFNRAYNPYCAYNPKYSCPVPPAENHLETPIKAGVKYANTAKTK